MGSNWEAIGIDFSCIFVWDVIGKQLGLIFDVSRLEFDWEAIGKRLGSDLNQFFVYFRLGFDWEAIGKQLGSIFRVFSSGI